MKTWENKIIELNYMALPISPNFKYLGSFLQNEAILPGSEHIIKLIQNGRRQDK